MLRTDYSLGRCHSAVVTPNELCTPNAQTDWTIAGWNVGRGRGEMRVRGEGTGKRNPLFSLTATIYTARDSVVG
jgi:hypothetical protein